jgi:uncharacterized cupin superfamily protein
MPTNVRDDARPRRARARRVEARLHFHHGSDEPLVVLRGAPTVRMHDRDHVLREGEVVSFPRGREGGHQIRNDGEETARVLIVSTNAGPDVAEYGDAVEHAGPE